MLISRVEDEMSAKGRHGAGDDRDHSHEYETASELFDLMATNHSLENVSETLSASDLVILYKNIDLGTKLMSNAENITLRKPNQHVESVVYNDDPDSEDSEISEIYSKDDIKNVFMINKERLDIFNGPTSVENNLCQKLGELEIQTSSLSLQYDQHFLFKDPYIKEQLKIFNRIDSDYGDSALPTSLLDYICCKRLEDNYNFYLDNIIRYVKHTIEQLKRISNGEYLTDKAREKWKKVEDVAENDENTKVLANSVSIPLHVERKLNGNSSTWDDIIHSEVDIRSLSKILEKKIIVEVPKLISGSYKLFSKLCADNLVISCQREEKRKPPEKEKESRVDVLLHLERSESGQVISNISSIMILQPTSPIVHVNCPKILPLTYINDNIEEKKVKIIEIPEINESYDKTIQMDSIRHDIELLDEIAENESMDNDSNYCDESKNASTLNSDGSDYFLGDNLDIRSDIQQKEVPYNFISPNEFTVPMYTMNMSSLVEEESEDIASNPVHIKKSATKVRIKSPYENKSHIIDEKKRKRLLEIREKREKIKMAVSENCKVTKHKYGKGAIMPQPSSSVTKLSITNKSFYNSIYGQNINVEKQPMKKVRKSKNDVLFETPLDHLEDEEAPNLTPEQNNQKYINRSYYLDDAVTEMMYTDFKHSDCSSVREMLSGTASAVSDDFTGITQSTPQTTDSCQPNLSPTITTYDEVDGLNENPKFRDDTPKPQLILSSYDGLNMIVPSNSPKDENEDTDADIEKVPPVVECRKSIDKLYDLMRNIRKIKSSDSTSSKIRLISNLSSTETRQGQGSTIQSSDSGTSLKHHVTSSSPSSFSSEKNLNSGEVLALKTVMNQKPDATKSVEPKVLISTKPVKLDTEKPKKEQKRVSINFLHKVNEHPLKAISQLLQEFDTVRNIRNKPILDSKPRRKPEIPNEGRYLPRHALLKRSTRFDQPLREIRGDKDIKNNETESKNIKLLVSKEKTKRPKSINSILYPLKLPHQMVIEEKHIERNTKKKFADILDEVKEAKGEAVRGPSKMNSRLNTLAQPKKIYVQAHSEEYQTKYGRNLMADRLQRLAAAPPSLVVGERAGRPRLRRVTTDAGSPVSVKPPSQQPLEHGQRARLSASSSLDGQAPPYGSYKQSHATDMPATLKNKMAAVETYVKSHYGRQSPVLMSKELLKARIPLVPKDLDIASLPPSPTGEGATAIGSKLHHIIDSIVNTKQSLSAVIESHEGNSKSNNNTDEYARNLLCDEAHSSIESDYRADIFEDRNVETAVEILKKNKLEEPIDIASDKSLIKSDCESDELKKLEDAFYGRLSMGTFQKKLKVHNVTSKSSMQHLFVLESGDTGSFVLKSSLSRSIKTNSSRSNDHMRTLTELKKSRVNWDLSNIPVQIATVGYAFPKYNSVLCRSDAGLKTINKIISLGISISSTSNKTNNKMLDKTHQCFKDFSKIPSKYNVEKERNKAHNNSENTQTKTFLSKDNPIKSSVSSVVCAIKDDEQCKEHKMFRADVNAHNSSKDAMDIPNKINVDQDTNNNIMKTESVDYTSSLDILVGLLNEIQKITACHMNNTANYASEQEYNELEALMNKALIKETVVNNQSHELVSVGSLDKFRHLESSPSVISLYISNNEQDRNAKKTGSSKTTATFEHNAKPLNVDKEVSTEFPVREFNDTSTEVASKVFPVTISKSTNVTSSLLKFIRQPSLSQTMISIKNSEIVFNDSISLCDKKIQEITNKDILQSQWPMIKYPEKELLNSVNLSKQVALKNQQGYICRIPMIEYHKREKHTNKNKILPINNKKSHVFEKTNCYVKGPDFDQILKVKRDILVTIYSILVLTVFAALSVPDILYHV